MHKLYELKDKLMNELEDYSENGKFSKDDAENIKALSASIEHICNICESEDEGGYSGRMYPDGMGGVYRAYARNDGRGGTAWPATPARMGNPSRTSSATCSV